MADQDPILTALFELKESTGRIEQKVDNHSSYEGRISAIENQISTLKGIFIISGALWAFLIAWVSGLGHWVQLHLTSFINQDA